MLKRTLLLASLLLCLGPICRAGTEQWVEVRSSHFVVLTDDGEKQGRHALDQFERMRWVFRTLFPNVNGDPAAPIVVFAAKNKKSFEALEPGEYLAKGQLTLAGLFLKAQDQDYILVRLDATEDQHPFATVYHEYTHSQFSKSQDWLPLWLNEGLAQFFENTDIHNKDVELGEPNRDAILYLRQTRLIPVQVLFTVDHNSPYYHEEEKGSVFYAESWALTHYILVTDHERKMDTLGDYMRLVARHEDPVTAAEKAFGDLKKLQASLASYIQSSLYKQFVLNSAAAPLDEASYSVRALTAAQADAERAEVLAAVGRGKDAQALVDSVLKEDPDNCEAREAMGMLAMREHDLEGARKWYGEAVKLNSQDFLAQYYFASMSMATGSSDDDADVEAALRAAIRLNPGFAPSYGQLAMFYGMRHEKLGEAYTLIVKAVQLEPATVEYRLNGASVLMGMGKFDDAQKVLAAALKLARNPQQSAAIESRIAQLSQIQAARAESGATPSVTVEAEDSPRVIEVNKETPPKHPTEPPTGPRHSFEGVMRGIACSYPSVIEFRVEGASKTISVYTNNYFKIELSALGFAPGNMNPCQDFEGRKARVDYAEVSDKSVDGQVIAVELMK